MYHDTQQITSFQTVSCFAFFLSSEDLKFDTISVALFFFLISY